MKPSMLLLLSLLALPSLAGCCKDKKTAGSQVLPTVTIQPPKRFELAGPSARHMLTDRYPRSSLRIELSVSYTQPGTVIDTVGLNAAREGSFALLILPTGQVQAQVYDPNRRSVARNSDGWHALKSEIVVPRGRKTSIVFESWKEDMALWVGGKLTVRINLATPLSGEPMYLGDFPGDDGMGPRHRIHTSMTGSVDLAYFGQLDPKTYVANRGLKVGP